MNAPTERAGPLESHVTTPQFSKDDRVVHALRPEWGVGRVLRAEATQRDGTPCQRLTIRFERAGSKTESPSRETLAAWERYIGVSFSNSRIMQDTLDRHRESYSQTFRKRLQASLAGDTEPEQGEGAVA